MKSLFTLAKLRLYVLFIIPIIYSCSKDKDDPEPPAITVSTSDFSATMDEKPQAGTSIGFVEGSTNLGGVTFSIIEQTPSGAISIDGASGELKVADGSLFNFETNPVISATVKVANGAVFKNASVAINLRKIADVKIFEGIALLHTQADVDAFGTEGYTHITETLNVGTFTIGGLSDIHDISSLSSLVHVGNQLVIGSNPDLVNLKGLENLKFVGGQMIVVQNASLTTIEALGNIEDYYNHLSIVENKSLINLDGLNFLEKVAFLNIIENNSLQNIDALSNLKEALEVRVQNNPTLTNIQALQNIKELDGRLMISSNNALQNLAGLEGITHIGQELFIANNSLLENIDPLRNLSTFPRNIDIRDNPLLRSISALKGMEYAHNLLIDNNRSLESLEGLNDLRVVSYYLQIINTKIQDLSPLSNLEYVKSIGIHHNPLLENMDGLIKLGIATQHLKISNNNVLKNLDGLANLNFVDRDLNIGANPNLSDFCGLQRLLLNNGLGRDYRVNGNAYNPSKQDIIDGNCRL